MMINKYSKSLSNIQLRLNIVSPSCEREEREIHILFAFKSDVEESMAIDFA